MKKLNIIRIAMLSIIAFFGTATASAQVTDIHELMNRTDLTLQEIEVLAKDYFNQVGTGQGSGNKQYERWRYEQQFHLNTDGHFRNMDEEYDQYMKALPYLRPQKATRAVWTNLGPTTQNVTSSWNPGHGRCWTVAINPSNTSIIYAGTDGGGIWKTSNAGVSWSPLLDFVNSSWQAIYHIAIAPSNTSVVYAGLKSGGVIKSTNSGSTWAATGSGPTSIKRIRVYPTNSNIVFATGSNGIYRSINGGTSWTLVKSGSTEDIQFNTANSNTMYASTSSTSTFWRSTDSGKTWVNIVSGITNSGRSLLGVSPNNSNMIYIVQASGSLFGRLYKSTDGGTTFTTTVIGSAASGTQYFGYETNGTGTTGQATHDMAIAVNPTNASEVHIAGIICWKSTNAGTSFTATTAWTWGNTFGYNHADVHSLVYQGSVLYSTSDGGVYKSINNAGDWSDISSNMGTRQFYRIACSKTSASVISGGAQDNGSSYRTTAGVWNEWLGADGMDAVISPTNSSVGIGTSQYGSIYRTTNAGASRSNLTSPASGNWVTPLAWHPTDGNIVFGGWNGVYKSTNQGTTWTNISGTTITSNVVCLTVAPSNANYIYASVGSTLYRTTNGGTTWTTSTAAAATISSICVSPLNPSKIWVTTTSSSNNVKVSTDNGTTFTNISTGLPAVAARSVAVENNADENLYVGMNIGVYYRNNINTTWVEHATGLPLVAVNEVEVQQSGGKLRVATYGRGVWESPLKSVAPKEQPVLQTYCEATANSTKEWIESVQIAAVENTSGNNNGYHYFDKNIAGLAVNNTYEIKVKPGFSDQVFKENWVVYIDYNQDGDFEDEHERVVSFNSINSEEMKQKISISTSAKVGYTVMRIVMQFNGFGEACSSNNDGEVEDYVLHIGSTENGYEVKEEMNALSSLTDKNLLIYPNPANDLLIVDLYHEQFIQDAKVSIIDLKGNVLYDIHTSIEKGTNSYRLKVSNVPSGMYMLQVKGDNLKINRKVLVSH